MFNPDTAPVSAYMPSFETTARSVKVVPIIAPVHGDKAASRLAPQGDDGRFDLCVGGLLSYGVDLVDIFRRAATYVDRILRGEKPGDLPVQFPVRYEMARCP